MSNPRRRFGQCCVLRPECAEEYKRVHANGHPGVRDLLSKHGLRNLSIYLQEIAGRLILFLYVEYEGDDYEGDMARLTAEPRDTEWHKLCDAMQTDMDGGPARWTQMEEIYYNA